mgnify:CR=1 FL=1
MKPNKIPLLALVLLLIALVGVPHASNAQMNREVRKILNSNWDQKGIVAPLDSAQKMALLSKLLPGDSVQFRDESIDDEVVYYYLNMNGLRFLDLNGDQNLDLLYSGISGTMSKTDTKVFLNDGKRLVYTKMLPGGIFHIAKRQDTLLVSTLWQPCCDSYTSRIETYAFHADDEGEFQSSISFIGRYYRVFIDAGEVQSMKKEPSATLLSLSGLATGQADSLQLHALPIDFRGVSAYFREKDREVKRLIRTRQPVPLLTLEETTHVTIISKKQFADENWFLVLTDIVNEVPKSLYEWSRGDRRRFIGWVKESDVTRQMK